MKYVDFYKQYPKYKGYIDNPVVYRLFIFLSNPINIKKMVVANDVYKKPPLYGVLTEVENNFHDPDIFSFCNDGPRQLTGSLVYYVLSYFGYKPIKPRRITKLKYFTSASIYEYTQENARYVLSERTEIIDKNTDEVISSEVEIYNSTLNN